MVVQVFVQCVRVCAEWTLCVVLLDVMLLLDVVYFGQWPNSGVSLVVRLVGHRSVSCLLQ